ITSPSIRLRSVALNSDRCTSTRQRTSSSAERRGKGSVPTKGKSNIDCSPWADRVATATGSRGARAWFTLEDMPQERILIVDDDPWILRIVSALLEKKGYLVITASDGDDGLHRAEQLRPDLIISDVMMPRMDGWAMIKSLRARPDLAMTPVIFLTALGSEE